MATKFAGRLCWPGGRVAQLDTVLVLSLSSPEGGESRGEEAKVAVKSPACLGRGEGVENGVKKRPWPGAIFSTESLIPEPAIGRDGAKLMAAGKILPPPALIVLERLDFEFLMPRLAADLQVNLKVGQIRLG